MDEIDYTIYYKRKIDKLSRLSETEYDLFISVYNDSFRVKEVFDKIGADIKHWIILPEYDYTEIEIPSASNVFRFNHGKNESEIIREYFDEILSEEFFNKDICIDITGFLTHIASFASKK